MVAVGHGHGHGCGMASKPLLFLDGRGMGRRREGYSVVTPLCENVRM